MQAAGQFEILCKSLYGKGRRLKSCVTFRGEECIVGTVCALQFYQFRPLLCFFCVVCSSLACCCICDGGPTLHRRAYCSLLKRELCTLL